ncbi:pentapeptide repeat-containing protein [Actinomycetospora sp. NBRC 106375]|uniref:pentapeptide repeat-containing protein n=1 Tax=Actinomycetospora sp. NBRC 106375 TaxID=3032207 RepID=UPI0025555CBC|nr:pentapeptide repeat-containing protein [Actinomycetospora sp. NBRC 106375]
MALVLAAQQGATAKDAQVGASFTAALEALVERSDGFATPSNDVSPSSDDGHDTAAEAQHVGGVIGLQQVMASDPTRQRVVITVLSTYITTHGMSGRNHGRSGAQDQNSYWLPTPDDCPMPPGRPDNSAPYPEVVAAMAALGSRDIFADHLPGRVVLGGTCLRNLDLGGQRALFVNADMAGTSLRGARLQNADFSGIVGISLSLISATLDGSRFSGADLRAANLAHATLAGSDLSRAWLAGVDLSGADLSQANLAGARLGATDTGRRGAYCPNPPFACWQLGPADLSGADLSGVDLRTADIGGVDLSRAAVLHNTVLTPAQAAAQSLTAQQRAEIIVAN